MSLFTDTTITALSADWSSAGIQSDYFALFQNTTLKE
jgi:hypothetical protein